MTEYRGSFLPIEGGDPGRQPGETVPLLEAQQRLRADDTVFAGFLHSLLLGYWTKEGGVSRAGLEDFERYGTQWRPELRREIPFQTISSGQGDEQLPDSQLTLRIAPSRADLLNEAKNDVGWIAQFYLRVNPFFWPMPGTYSPAVAAPFKIAGPMDVPGTELPTRLYPGPDCSLAMVMVIGLPAPSDKVSRRVYSIVSPILDELSVRFDHPFPLAQLVVIGIPSGVATVSCSKPSEEAALRDGDSICDFPKPFPHVAG